MSKSLPLTKPRPRWAEAAWDSVVSESDEHAIDQIVTGGHILGGVWRYKNKSHVGANTFIAPGGHLKIVYIYNLFLRSDQDSRSRELMLHQPRKI